MKNIFYDKSKVDYGNLLFPRRALWMLLIPLIIEQMLNSLMGMVDTLMVSRVGAEAISAVSLVDSINNLVLQVFAAMAAGAAIICSQYLGRKDEKGCNDAAKQIVLTVVVISSVIMIIGVGFRKPLLHLIFGSVEEAVMTNAQMYFLITALSYPFIALFQAGAAFYRACGNSKFTMKTALIANVANIVGNTLFIFILQMGAAGAAISTLISRAVCAFVVFYALRKPGYAIQLKNYFSIRPDLNLIVKILAIGVPSGIENGMFQFGKLAIQSTVSSLGTAAIAAQAMTIIFENVNGMAAVGIGIGLMTVVGQSIGAGRQEEAKYYIVKLAGYAEVAMIISCILVYIAARPVTVLAGMSEESTALCMQMILAITIVKPILWVPSFTPPNGLRAAGDVRFSMITATLTMWLCRVALSIFLMRVVKTGPIGVWYGMFADWGVRGVIFTIRFVRGKWLRFKVI
ncbi:MATE family efflux transporter [Anthropogastromicrobium aceti]|uniref:Probable multidrug resistance protein NorM n=1 Tax=Anthropogastromicrobium aceti TaxID=2981768 RepID=A0AAE3E3G5_9FIRM|nr:MATE family efflux transporter [Anthropogastromicrobium aceti]MCC2221493.1 MATE family efflux transporter [Anthropogastromicrobium aceti]